MEKEDLKPVIEAIIFAADHPVSIEKLSAVLQGESREDLKAAVIELKEDYSAAEQGRRGLSIEEVAGGFQLRTRVEHAPWLRRFFKVGMQRISKAAIETLAIVAYKQPLTRAELESVRGVDSAGVLKTLLERRLIKIVGRKDAPGRPVVYGTTKEFLETFEMKDLSALPTLKEIEALDEEETDEDAALIREDLSSEMGRDMAGVAFEEGEGGDTPGEEGAEALGEETEATNQDEDNDEDNDKDDDEDEEEYDDEEAGEAQDEDEGDDEADEEDDEADDEEAGGDRQGP